MPKSGNVFVLRKANKRGVTIGDLYVEAIQQYGSTTRVSAQFGVAPNTVRYHLERAGWHFDKALAQWVKPQPEAAR